MKQEIVYKVVRKCSNNEYWSARTMGNNSSVMYKIGNISSNIECPLFAFKDLVSAIKFKNSDEVILKCYAKLSVKQASQVLYSGNDVSNNLHNFWNWMLGAGGGGIAECYQLMDPVPGTVFCDDIIPSEEVKLVEVYKVVSVSNNKYVSYGAYSSSRYDEYKIGEVVENSKKPLFAFKDLESAISFNCDGKIIKCWAVLSSRQPKCMSSKQSNDDKFWKCVFGKKKINVLIDDIPKGTVFCSHIYPIEMVV